MKISCKNEFHSLVSSFCALLKEDGISLKTSRAQELLSHAFDYRSANGLLADVPVDLKVTKDVITRLGHLLRKRHHVVSVDYSYLLRALARQHRSYSTHYECDNDCYPTNLPDRTNYWYLTQEGWVPWNQMDFTKMRVELNIYKVVSSSTGIPLAPGEPPFLCFARPLWTADIASSVFEAEAERLERKFGEWPETGRMYPELRNAL